MENDLYERLKDFKKTEILNSEGVNFSDFRKELSPRYPIVLRDILLGWGGLILLIALAIFSGSEGWWISILPISCLIGYVIAYLQLFLHEAAHFNLCKSKSLNDRLCNGFVSLLSGVDVKSYRKVHFDHHKFFGTEKDTEITYNQPLTVRFVLETLTGISVLRVLFTRKKKEGGDPRRDLFQLALFLLFNGAVVAFCWLFGGAIAVSSWLLGVLMWYPFFGALRQLLEHRPIPENSREKPIQTNRGGANYLFHDWISPSFGAAGFDRHLLHHWDPQISYTNLADVENFLLDSQFGPELKQSTRSYFGRFSELFEF